MKRELTKRLIQRFYIQALLYAGAIILLSGAGYIWCSRRIWYLDSPFYPLIHFLHENWLTIFLLLLVVGILILTSYHMRTFVRTLDTVLQAVECMESEREMPPMPSSMQEVQQQLGQIKQQVEKSRIEAREANQRRNDLIMYMAHDLKTPLTSVIGYLSLLEEELELSPQVRAKYTSVALHKAQRLEELINEFFDITRFQLSHMALVKHPIDIKLMLEQIAYEFRPVFAEKGIRYELQIQERLEVNCDADKMERVFDNLLKNAFHYSYENSMITIFAKMDAGQVHIIVRNEGQLLSKEQVQRVFEPFFRTDSSRSTNSGGAGLGLAIAKDIVEAHGGMIFCANEEKTVAFHVLIPVK